MPQEPLSAKADRRDLVAQSLVRAVLYATPAVLCAYAASVGDADIWWHLRSGEWIMQHRAAPHTDPFSSFGAGKSWAAYSWLFEIAVLQLFERLGLVGIVLYTTGMVLAITVALHHLVKRLHPDFTIGVLLTFIASLSLWRLNSPRPWHFTILFFILELDILMQARRTGRRRELVWLPVLFAFWANLHIQFLDGLLFLALATTESVVATWWTAARTRLTLPAILPVFFACILATLCNPYGAHIYKVALDLSAQPGVMDHLAELQAIPFRNVPDFLGLLLALAAAAALGRSRQFRFFEWVAFAAAIFLSFRSQRDVWIVVSIASATMASCSERSGPKGRANPVLAWSIIAPVAGMLLFAAFRVLHVTNDRLAAQLEEELPVRAAAFARAEGFRGPLYNDYPWGGYLMWSLRQPVAIDGRAAFYGDQRMDRLAATWNAATDWNSDAELRKSRLVIGPVRAPLTQLLRLDPQLRLVFEDGLAAVFISRADSLVECSPASPPTSSCSSACIPACWTPCCAAARAP